MFRRFFHSFIFQVLLGSVGSGSLRAPPNLHECSCTRLELTAMLNKPGWSQFGLLHLLVAGTRTLGDLWSCDRLEAMFTQQFAEFNFLFNSNQFNQFMVGGGGGVGMAFRLGGTRQSGPPAVTFLRLTDGCVPSWC